LTDTNSAATDAWFYAPYGSVLNRTGSTDTPFQWLGGHGVRTEACGLHFMRYRYYNAGLKRFVSADPIGLAGGGNLYWYANGNPLALMDFLGLCTGWHEPPSLVNVPQRLWRPEDEYSRDTLSSGSPDTQHLAINQFYPTSQFAGTPLNQSMGMLNAAPIAAIGGGALLIAGPEISLQIGQTALSVASEFWMATTLGTGSALGHPAVREFVTAFPEALPSAQPTLAGGLGATLGQAFSSFFLWLQTGEQ
jgi:RHS repeat-associated protein